MKKIFLTAAIVAAFALGANSQEVLAQSAKMKGDPQLQERMALMQAKMNRIDPKSADYKVMKAEYDRLVEKEKTAQAVNTAQKRNVMRAPAVAKAATKQPAVATKTSVTATDSKNSTYAKLRAYEAAHPINEPNKRVRHIRTMERQRDFYLQNGDAATAAKVNNDIANFKAEASKACPNCWMGEGEKPVGQ